MSKQALHIMIFFTQYCPGGRTGMPVEQGGSHRHSPADYRDGSGG